MALTTEAVMKGSIVFGTIFAILAAAAVGQAHAVGVETPGRPAVTGAAAIERALTASPRARIDLTVNFATDSDRIEGAAHAQLYEIAVALMYPSLRRWRVMIEGHTDSVGPASYNLDLSYRRAVAVARALTELYGIDPRRLAVRGFGETHPIADNRTRRGRALNRRVTLVNWGRW
jgi:OOP family OmpA-OmpF porin